jgi:hypothetical protein
MALKIGSTSIGSLYLGSTKISQAYLGNVKVYSSVAPGLPAYTLRYKFYDSSFDPTSISVKGTWTQVSASPNVWDWTYQNSNWDNGPFKSTASASMPQTGLYDVMDAGDNTGVNYLRYFFGTSDAVYQIPHGPVSVCDLHIRPLSVKGLFRGNTTLTSFTGNIDISNLEVVVGSDGSGFPTWNTYMQDVYYFTSLTSLPPFAGTKIVEAGHDYSLDMRDIVAGCSSMTDFSNFSTLDVRLDNLANMSPNDGIRMDGALTITPLLTITGNECNGWHRNALPIRVMSQASSAGGAQSVRLSPNKVNIFNWRFRNQARFKYLFYDVGLTTVPDFTNFNYTGCDFEKCFHSNFYVTSGALAAYTKLSSLSGTVGTECFRDCGSNTQTGQADLDQIPQSWGGNLVVQDYYLGTSWSKWKNNTTYGTIWVFTSNIDYSVLTSMQIYTESSVSSYAGVNMRKTNVKNIKGTFTTSSDCYYWPCICQFDSSYNVTWYLHTQNYNGMLTSAQTAGDMPGTLSAATLGTMSVSGGTFDSNTAVKFCFMVTNTSNASDIIANHGILYNSNFYANPAIRVATSTLTPSNAYIGE